MWCIHINKRCYLSSTEVKGWLWSMLFKGLEKMRQWRISRQYLSICPVGSRETGRMLWQIFESCTSEYKANTLLFHLIWSMILITLERSFQLGAPNEVWLVFLWKHNLKIVINVKLPFWQVRVVILDHIYVKLWSLF